MAFLPPGLAPNGAHSSAAARPHLCCAHRGHQRVLRVKVLCEFVIVRRVVVDGRQGVDGTPAAVDLRRRRVGVFRRVRVVVAA
jgi:hypothetical protein